MEWEDTLEFVEAHAYEHVMQVRNSVQEPFLRDLTGAAAQAVQQTPDLLRGAATAQRPQYAPVYTHHHHQRILQARYRVISWQSGGGQTLIPQGRLRGMYYIASPTPITVPAKASKILNVGHQYWLEDGLIGMVRAIPWESDDQSRSQASDSSFSGLTSSKGYHLRLDNPWDSQVEVRIGQPIALLFFFTLAVPQLTKVLPDDHGVYHMTPKDSALTTTRPRGPCTPPGSPPPEQTSTSSICPSGQQQLVRAMSQTESSPSRNEEEFAPTAPPLEALFSSEDRTHRTSRSWPLVSTGDRSGGRGIQSCSVYDLQEPGSRSSGCRTNSSQRLYSHGELEEGEVRSEDEMPYEQSPEAIQQLILVEETAWKEDEEKMDRAIKAEFDEQERREQDEVEVSEIYNFMLVGAGWKTAGEDRPKGSPLPPPTSPPLDLSDFRPSEPPPPVPAVNFNVRPPRLVPLDYHQNSTQRDRQLADMVSANYWAIIIEDARLKEEARLLRKARLDEMFRYYAQWRPPPPQ